MDGSGCESSSSSGGSSGSNRGEASPLLVGVRESSSDQEMRLGSDSDRELRLDALEADPLEGKLSLPEAEKEEDVDEESGCVGARRWHPGRTVGDWFGAGNSLTEQCQILIVNVVIVLRSLSRNVLEALNSAIGVGGRTTARSLRCAAGLLRLSTAAIWRCYKAAEERNWVPVRSDRDALGAGDGPEIPHSGEPERVMRTLVRSALSHSVMHGSVNQFVRRLAALDAEGVAVGEKHHSRKFMWEAHYLAVQCLQCRDMRDAGRALPGLGVRSDFALLFDGVPIGGMSAHNRHGQALVICSCSVSTYTGRLHPRFLTWAENSQGHAGSSTARCVLDALAAEPLGMTAAVLRECVSCVGGDGAVVRGGPDRTSHSTQAADILWFELHPLAEPSEEDALVALGQPRNPARPRREAQPGVERHHDGQWAADAHKLFTATEWDKYHREDIALRRAIDKSALAQDMFDLCIRMDHLFGLGDGRFLLRSSADAVRNRTKSTHMPGGTRKAVGLTAEPGHLLHNFRAYAAGLHLREAWRKDGHRFQQTKEALRADWLQLTRLRLVVFTLVFRDILRALVAPWSLAVQRSSAEPWVLQRLYKEKMCLQVDAMHLLDSARDLLRVLVLLGQWVPVPARRHLYHAVFFARPSNFFLGGAAAGGSDLCFGRQFPGIFSALADFLLTKEAKFSGVELHCGEEAPAAEVVIVGPHCQCAFHQRGAGPRARTTLRRRGRDVEIRVPRWVVGGARSVQAGERPRECGRTLGPIRFTRVSTGDVHALGGGARFRRRAAAAADGWVSRCVVSSQLPHIFRDIDEAIGAGRSFVYDFTKEEEVLFGPEGASAGYAQAIAAMSQCFDWERLVRERPTAEDARALKTLYELLLPYLLHASWPPCGEFPGVVHAWPSADVMARQYFTLAARVRAARYVIGITDQWHTIQKLKVRRVGACAGTLRIVLKLFEARCSTTVRPRESRDGLEPKVARARARALCLRIASHVSECLGERPGDLPADQRFAHARPSFWASPGMLARCGVQIRTQPRTTRRKTRVAAAEKWRYRPGDPGNLAILLLPGVEGKVVQVEEISWRVDPSAISSSIDRNPYFARGPSARSECAWHAARLHHRCRSFGAAEAYCERIGSLMKAHWLTNPSQNAASFMNSVYLHAAGLRCVGSERDEEVVREVADTMMSLGRTPFVGGKQSSRRKKQGLRGASRALQSLREEDVKSLVEGGRVFRDPRLGEMSESSSSSSSLDLASTEAHALEAKRPRLEHSLHRRFDGGLGDVAIAARTARQRVRPKMSLTRKMQEQLEDIAEGVVRPLAWPRAAAAAKEVVAKPSTAAPSKDSITSTKKPGKARDARAGGRATSSKGA